jgi:hypothetical protein
VDSYEARDRVHDQLSTLSFANGEKAGAEIKKQQVMEDKKSAVPLSLWIRFIQYFGCSEEIRAALQGVVIGRQITALTTTRNTQKIRCRARTFSPN